MNTKPIPCMATIRQTAAMGILPEHALRQMEKDGRLPSIKAGNRTLINVDRLIEQLNQLGTRES